MDTISDRRLSFIRDRDAGAARMEDTVFRRIKFKPNAWNYSYKERREMQSNRATPVREQRPAFKTDSGLDCNLYADECLQSSDVPWRKLTILRPRRGGPTRTWHDTTPCAAAQNPKDRIGKLNTPPQQDNPASRGKQKTSRWLCFGGCQPRRFLHKHCAMDSPKIPT